MWAVSPPFLLQKSVIGCHTWSYYIQYSMRLRYLVPGKDYEDFWSKLWWYDIAKEFEGKMSKVPKWLGSPFLKKN